MEAVLYVLITTVMIVLLALVYTVMVSSPQAVTVYRENPVGPSRHIARVHRESGYDPQPWWRRHHGVPGMQHHD